MKEAGHNETYMLQLDTLRAIAVVLVIISHWFSQDHFLNRYTDNGVLGVTLFFVLSGYLITGILLKSKSSIEKGGSIKEALKTFYVRRALRIFPVYYLLLLVLLLFNIANIKESFLWHFFYLSNVHAWYTSRFPGWLSHFWSLSVEEQFYLFWPAIVLFIPRSKLIPFFITSIILSTVFRVFVSSPPFHFERFLLPGSFDSFCIGGLLAFGQQGSKNWYTWTRSNLSKLFILSFGLFLAYHAIQKKLEKPSSDYVFLGSYFLIISTMFGLVIMKCSIGVKNRFLKPVLNNKFLIYLGKISYGLYLYHNFIPYFYNLELPEFLGPFTMYVVQSLRFIILLVLATFSWYVIEKPLLKFKKRFDYKNASLKEHKEIERTRRMAFVDSK
jgi:peptidoglycan/LPS O-acetylase OafA/YrhL